jgi:hypothetical protein
MNIYLNSQKIILSEPVFSCTFIRKLKCKQSQVIVTDDCCTYVLLIITFFYKQRQICSDINEVIVGLCQRW